MNTASVRTADTIVRIPRGADTELRIRVRTAPDTLIFERYTKTDRWRRDASVDVKLTEILGAFIAYLNAFRDVVPSITGTLRQFGVPDAGRVRIRLSPEHLAEKAPLLLKYFFGALELGRTPGPVKFPTGADLETWVASQQGTE